MPPYICGRCCGGVGVKDASLLALQVPTRLPERADIKHFLKSVLSCTILRGTQVQGERPPLHSCTPVQQPNDLPALVCLQH